MDYRNGTPLAQVNALLAFKQAQNDPLGALQSWRVPSSSSGRRHRFWCGWRGVQCSDSGDVVALELFYDPIFSESLEGNLLPFWGKPEVHQSLPPDIGQLTALSVLNLQYNAMLRQVQFLGAGLVGPIPSELGNCTRLTAISLSGNSLTGSIPDSLSRLVRLQSLALHSNLLQGTLPAYLFQMTTLTALSFKYNNFSGPLPSTAQLPGLDDLRLIRMPVTGGVPEGLLRGMPSLTYLDMSDMPFVSGSIPRSISRLSRLGTLFVRALNLTGPLPPGPWWAKLTALTWLELTGPTLGAGPLPEVLPPQLNFLNISSTAVYGTIPDSMMQGLCGPRAEGINPLTQIMLADNRLLGPLPSSLSLCTALTLLDVSGNSFNGSLGRGASLLAGSRDTLVQLSLAHNNLTGTVPANLMLGSPSLRQLYLDHNGFSGRAPPVWCAPGMSTPYSITYSIRGNFFEGDVGILLRDVGRCPAYSTFDLGENRLSGRLPRGWLENVYQMRLDGNNITGPLPPPPANCSQLSVLVADRNQLSGRIPRQLFSNCSSLVTLTLSENSLWGGVPGPGGASPVQDLSLAANNLSGPIPPNLSGMADLRRLNLSHNFLEGTLPARMPRHLASLDVSSNGLSGPIPAQLGLLRNLTSLSLAVNNLTGPIPPLLAPPSLPNLSTLNLSHNMLSGSIPWGFANHSLASLDLSFNNLRDAVPGGAGGTLSSNSTSLSGNPALCGGAAYPDCPPPAAPEGPETLSAGAVAGIVLGSVAAAAAIVGVGVWLLWSRPTDEWSRGTLLTFQEFRPHLTIHHLLEATEGFSSACKLGEGGFGSVYKATLPHGTEVAIKRLAQGGTQGMEEFLTEVGLLGKLSHRNIVQLLAAYVATPPHTECLLVYKFLPGGSLDKALTGSLAEDSPLRRWEQRRSIATDVARGMKYLHHHCDPRIIHRDMKPANVMLDASLTAYVADFGLAKVAKWGQSHETLEIIAGTAGFVAPEYVTHHRMSCKGDVYAYGVTLIQLMTGRGPTEEDIADAGLSRWAQGGMRILDPNMSLVSEQDKLLALGLLKIGILCISRVPVDRPNMEEVLGILEDLEAFCNAQDLVASSESPS